LTDSARARYEEGRTNVKGEEEEEEGEGGAHAALPIGGVSEEVEYKVDRL
jgi:hypothetical protein